jgi:hypothetical protein
MSPLVAQRLAFVARLFSWFSLRNLFYHPWRAGSVLPG